MKVLRTKLSRRYLAAAWAYRRAAGAAHDFSLEKLQELYEYETHGKGNPDKLSNGYLYGKWLMDLTVQMWREEHSLGNFTKYELLIGCPTHYRDVIRKFQPRAFFAY